MTQSEKNTLYALLSLEVILGVVVSWVLSAVLLGYDNSVISITNSFVWSSLLLAISMLVLIVWPVWLIFLIRREHPFLSYHLMAHGLITIVLPFNLITAAAALWMGYQKRPRGVSKTKKAL